MRDPGLFMSKQMIAYFQQMHQHGAHSKSIKGLLKTKTLRIPPMKKITTIALLTLTSALAQAYQVEVNGGYSFTDLDIDGSDGLDNYNIGGTYYIAPVVATNGPLAEAAFLQNASNVILNYANSSSNDIDFEVDAVTVGGEYYLPNDPFYVSASYSSLNLEFGPDDSDADVFTASVGYLPVSNALLTIGLLNADADDDSETDVTLGAKYVGDTGANFYNLEGSVVFADDDNIINAAADFYVNPNASIGVTYADGDLLGEDQFGVRGQYFFTPQYAIGASYTSGEIADIDADTYGISATARF